MKDSMSKKCRFQIYIYIYIYIWFNFFWVYIFRNLFTTVGRDVTSTHHWRTWKHSWRRFLKCMECGGVLTVVQSLYLHEMPQRSMIHFFKRVGTAFKEKEVDRYHCWFSTVPAKIYKYRLLVLDLWWMALYCINSCVWIIFVLLLLILVVPTVHTRWDILF